MYLREVGSSCKKTQIGEIHIRFSEFLEVETQSSRKKKKSIEKLAKRMRTIVNRSVAVRGDSGSEKRPKCENPRKISQNFERTDPGPSAVQI